MSTGKSASAEKPPRIKGLVKRCRSFKEDLISRLARNRSVGKDEAAAYHFRGNSNGGRSKGQSCHSEGTSPVPPGSNQSSTRRSDVPDRSNSQFIISNRVKEAYLTLSFVESLIQKRCIDLLGGSSNVMLDLMGNLLNEIKKTSIGDSEPYQSAITFVKTALTEFLTSVDALLLFKEKYDETQQKFYFDNVLEALNNARESITKLKSLIEAKENGHGHYGSSSNNSGYSGSTPALLTSTPTSSVSGTTVNAAGTGNNNKFLHSPGSRSTGEDSNSQSLDTGFCSEEKRPPLPPKLKQWTAKSFDNYMSSSPPSTSPIHHQRFSNQQIHHQSRHHHHYQHQHHIDFPFNPAEHSYSASLLSQWLEESSLNSTNHSRRRQSSATTSSYNQLSKHHHQPNQNTSTENCDWTDSAVFVSNNSTRTNSIITSSKVQATITGPNSNNNNSSCLGLQQRNYDSCSQYSDEPSANGSHLQLTNSNNNRKLRTFSDSFYGVNNKSDSDSDDDENIHLLNETRSHHTGGTRSRCSQSLSTGSSLDNLLLVDSNSTRSAGMSPNSQRISVSSNTTNTQSPLLLAGAGGNSSSGYCNNYDGELECDVFLNENDNVEKLVIVDQDQDDNNAPPPELPKKMKPGCFLTSNSTRNFIIGGHVYSCINNNNNNRGGRFNGAMGERCPSPYDNVDSETLESLDPTTSQPRHQNSQDMSCSESKHTLVSASGAIGQSGSSGDTPFEEKPPLPPKKKHSITAYVELMNNFDVQNYQYHGGGPHIHLFHHHQHFHKGTFSVIQSVGQSCSSHGSSSNSGGCQSRGSIAGPSAAGETQGNNSSYQHFSSFSSTGTSVFGPTAEEDPNALDSESHEQRCSSAIAAAFQYQYQPMINPTNTSSFESDTNQISNSNSSLSPSSNNNTNASPNNKPPALPPKKYKQQLQHQVPSIKHSFSEQGVSKNLDLNPMTGLGSCSTSTSNVPRQLELHYDQSLLPAESSQSELASPTGRSSVMSIPSLGPVQSISSPMPSEQMDLVANAEEESNDSLYLLEVSENLIKNETPQIVKGTTTEGPEIKGADPISLLIYAANPYLEDAKFREVFLLTYRTFLPPINAINLLWRRYQYFDKRSSERTYVLNSRATLDLFLDVIISMTPMDLEDEVVAKIRESIYHLIMAGELLSALKARRGLITKSEVRFRLLSPKTPQPTLAVTIESNSLLQWSATSTAQQMTLLDAELFRHLEPAELLLWAREQSEDFCPALNNFTDHFNKVSYWARSRVLLCANSRERNRTMKKLIEVMRKLREFNNFNSLLAVLAALDSAPIRRLGFSKRLTEALKPHAALTDSSGSFRTYRQALSESKPPCIPYIGLVLQDLTFVHIGNADLLPDGKVNWIKRWQQWIVLEPIRRFYDCRYGFVKNDSLLAFLNNFDDALNDDDLWSLSESIKPRGKN